LSNVPSFPPLVPPGAGIGKATAFRTSLTHGNTPHLAIQLQSPGGVIRNLSDDNGSGANYRQTRFDDAAASAITAGSSPFTGSFRPEATLSTTAGTDFRGSNAAGDLEPGNQPDPPRRAVAGGRGGRAGTVMRRG